VANMLLMEAFPRPDGAAPRITPAAAALARGEGPQQLQDPVHGAWNLYSWRAVTPALGLPRATDRDASEHWIWNEGTLAAVPLFEGRRVILLGPPAYARSWRAQRLFSVLPASLTIEETLSPEQVRAHLERMAHAETH
jgi:hypothetical protein